MQTGDYFKRVKFLNLEGVRPEFRGKECIVRYVIDGDSATHAYVDGIELNDNEYHIANEIGVPVNPDKIRQI